ncbi:hypothetical protein ACFQO7_35265 [Catellatospora aurea]|uniref:Uncharacterized protein n=1 Tax=Catellatospora aurea TaxID=1337874 RepID=A0ABW2H675_9ACTN
MIENLRKLMFEPRYPIRYIGRHRAPSVLPSLTLAVRRSRTTSVA